MNHDEYDAIIYIVDIMNKHKELKKALDNPYRSACHGLGYNVAFSYYDDLNIDIPNRRKPRTNCALKEYNEKRIWATSNHGFLTYMRRTEVKSCPGAFESHPEMVYLENIKVHESTTKNGDSLLLVKAVDAATYDMISIMFVKKKYADKYEYTSMMVKKANTIKDEKYTKGDGIRYVDVLMPDIDGNVTTIIYDEDDL